MSSMFKWNFPKRWFMRGELRERFLPELLDEDLFPLYRFLLSV